MTSLFLLIGSLLNSICFVGGFIYNAIAARNGTEALLDVQVTLTFFNAFSFFVFGIGLHLLALNFIGETNSYQAYQSKQKIYSSIEYYKK